MSEPMDDLNSGGIDAGRITSEISSWPLRLRLLVRLPSALGAITYSKNDPDRGAKIAALAKEVENLGEPFKVLCKQLILTQNGVEVKTPLTSCPSSDEGALTRMLMICILSERSSTTLGRKAAVRSYRNISMYETRDPIEFHWEAAHKFLQEWGNKNGHKNLGEDQFARQCLGQSFHKHVTLLYKKIMNFESIGSSIPPKTEEKDGMLWYDAILFDLYEGLGPTGKGLAEKYRKTARSRWEKYKETGDSTYAWLFWCEFEGGNEDQDISGGPPDKSHFDEALLEILWDDQIHYQWERATKNRPAIPLVIADTLDRACFYADRSIEVRDQVPSVIVEQTVIAVVPATKVATLDSEVLTTLEQSVGILGSLTGHRVVRFLISTYHRQYFESLDRNPTHIRIDGGLDGFAHAVGEHSKKASDSLLKILQAGQRLCIQWPGGVESGLWTYVYNDKTGWGKKAFLEIRLGFPLAPLYAKPHLPKNQQILVPLVALPPLVSPNKFFAQQAAFQFGVVRELVERRQELHKEGGALFKEDDFARIGAKYGLPNSTRMKAMERWLRDDSDGLRVFELVGSNRYHLADNEVYGDARRFIDETVRKAAEGRQRAIRGMRK